MKGITLVNDQLTINQESTGTWDCLIYKYVFTQHLFHERDVTQGQFLSEI